MYACYGNKTILRSKDALRIVPYFVLLQSCPIFAYREACAPLLCSYRGGSLSHKTTPVQAHRGFRLLTLASSDIFYHKKESSPILRELLLITLLLFTRAIRKRARLRAILLELGSRRQTLTLLLLLIKRRSLHHYVFKYFLMQA